MTTQEYITFFKEQSKQSNRKSEKRALNKFVVILNDLEQRELTSEKKEHIVTELDRLQLSPQSPKSKKSITRRLSAFTNFLNKEYSLVCEGYYTSLWMVFGISFGVGIGTAIGTAIDPAFGTSIGISMGVGLGMAIGLAIGATKDKEALAAGRVIKMKK